MTAQAGLCPTRSLLILFHVLLSKTMLLFYLLWLGARSGHLLGNSFCLGLPDGHIVSCLILLFKVIPVLLNRTGVYDCVNS